MNNFALSDAEDNPQGLLNREGIADMLIVLDFVDTPHTVCNFLR